MWLVRYKSLNRIAFLSILILGMKTSLHPETHYVDNEAFGSNNGSSWTDAWKSFEDIDWRNINPDDTLLVN